MKNYINKILEKRFQTTMIGSLYEFEESFGYLWGQDKEGHQLTEQEQKFRIKWEDTRNQILNNGNNQLRKCLSDLEKTQANTVKYNYNFKKGYR
jgi:dsDNA-specific endonuclease/ATPase MutS2